MKKIFRYYYNFRKPHHDVNTICSKLNEDGDELFSLLIKWKKIYFYLGDSFFGTSNTVKTDR